MGLSSDKEDVNKNDKDKYIAQLEKENAQLKEQVKELRACVHELERRLGMNSQNSSKPPSTDAPDKKPKQGTRKKRRKKKGAQKGHKPHVRELVPKEQVTHFVNLVPKQCTCGCDELEVCDEPAIRFQTFDLPPIKPEVNEYVQHMRKCKKCGTIVYLPLSDDIKRNVFGPGVLSVVSILTGMLNTSKRKAREVMNEVFCIPMSLGGLSNCEARITAALETPYDEVVDYVQQQASAHADESSWRRGNRIKGWVWTLCCTTAAVFMIHASRGQKAARKLLGNFCGILNTDRWNGYWFYQYVRQICWAHLKRDFKAISESKGRLGKIGKELHALAREILKLRRRVRDGTLQWKTFQSRMISLKADVERLLEKGATYEGALGGKCRDILKYRAYLWTFVDDPNVEPTNNAAEQIIRQAVLWRKTSFGTQSQRGARYVERMLTVCATCRLQGRSIIVYMRNACHSYLNNSPAPSLTP
jgi:transposase